MKKTPLNGAVPERQVTGGRSREVIRWVLDGRTGLVIPLREDEGEYAAVTRRARELQRR